MRQTSNPQALKQPQIHERKSKRETFWGWATDLYFPEGYEICIEISQKGAAQVQIPFAPLRRNGKPQTFCGKVTHEGGTLTELNGHDSLRLLRGLNKAVYVADCICIMEIEWDEDLYNFLSGVQARSGT